jgi:hypothetical protein
MSVIREVSLTLSEVTAAIQKFEAKYGFSTVEFFANASQRAKVSEDDDFQWESLNDHQSELAHIEEELRREYLSQVISSQVPKSPSPEDQIELAA